MSRNLNIVVAGARRHKQGTGFYLARAFAKLGHTIAAVTTTNDDTLKTTLADFEAKHNIKPQGYTDVATALAEHKADILVIATPNETHLEYLRLGIKNNCHILCEKPLVAPTIDRAQDTEVSELLDDAHARGLHIGINTQWPHTLPSFVELYPQLKNVLKHGVSPETFQMLLCPEKTGIEMISDAAPHFFSMLLALCGIGKVVSPQVRIQGNNAEVWLSYEHTHGEVHTYLKLHHHLGQPKPATYAINNCVVERRIIMDGYRLSLGSPDGRQVALRDPLEALVEAFAHKISTDVPPDNELLQTIRAGMEHLNTLYRLIAQHNEPDEGNTRGDTQNG